MGSFLKFHEALKISKNNQNETESEIFSSLNLTSSCKMSETSLKLHKIHAQLNSPKNLSLVLTKDFRKISNTQ